MVGDVRSQEVRKSEVRAEDFLTSHFLTSYFPKTPYCPLVRSVVEAQSKGLKTILN
jgi:hypothetical protein